MSSLCSDTTAQGPRDYKSMDSQYKYYLFACAGNNERDTDTTTTSPSKYVDTPLYEQVDLKPNYEEITLNTNASYGMVKK